MAVNEEGLAVFLQASIDHAKELLEEQGGFLPFGARARIDGDIEFVEAEGDGGGNYGGAGSRFFRNVLGAAGGRCERVRVPVVAAAGDA